MRGGESSSTSLRIAAQNSLLSRPPDLSESSTCRGVDAEYKHFACVANTFRVDSAEHSVDSAGHSR